MVGLPIPKVMKARVCIVTFLLFSVGVSLLSAQDTEEELQRGFRDVVLGLSFEETEQRLAADLAFQYRGQPDVSMRLSDGESVIDTRGRLYVDRGLFQFFDGTLYSMALYLNRGRLDYFQLYEQLRGRYGEPMDLDPQRSVWQDQQTRIELERPLTVKYLDLARFEERRATQETLEAAEDLARDQFLEEF
jgi:hypothetical protein